MLLPLCFDEWERQKLVKMNIRKKNSAGASYQRGFTLIEVILVLVIIGIAAGLVGVYVGSGSGRLALRTLTKEISAVLRYARNHAASEKKNYCFIIENDDAVYRLTSRTSQEDAAAVTAVEKPIPEGLSVTVEDREDHDCDVEFYPRGNSSGGIVETRDEKGRGFFIVINRITGKVEVEAIE